MAGFASGKARAPITGINVTPLVDITLVLLIIFMVTAKLVVSHALPMDLPKAATGNEVEQILSIALQVDGTVLVNGIRSADDQHLLESARAVVAQHPDARAIVQADGSTEHRSVMHVLDVLRQAGLARVAFGVAPGPAVDTKQVQP